MPAGHRRRAATCGAPSSSSARGRRAAAERRDRAQHDVERFGRLRVLDERAREDAARVTPAVIRRARAVRKPALHANLFVEPAGVAGQHGVADHRGRPVGGRAQRRRRARRRSRCARRRADRRRRCAARRRRPARASRAGPGGALQSPNAVCASANASAAREIAADGEDRAVGTVVRAMVRDDGVAVDRRDRARRARRRASERAGEQRALRDEARQHRRRAVLQRDAAGRRAAWRA